MTITLLTTILGALMTVAALTAAVLLRHSRAQARDLQSRLDMAEKERLSLERQVLLLNQKGGVSEPAILAIAGEIALMENNLYHMSDVPGRKQIAKAIERVKACLQAEDYVIVPLLGKAYEEGMQMKAVILPDDSIPYGSSVISSVQKPQVNRAGRMIQAATVTVRQNI